MGMGLMSLILALDTATPAVTAGIVRRDDLAVLAERVTVDARAHAERLTPNVLAALADAGLTMADLDAVVVGCGPGPFTGLRAGMASAAAYGHALGIPVYGVCSLDAIGVLTTGDTLVVTDARRREIYWARYQDGVRTDGPAVNAPADVDAATACAVAGSPEHAALFDLPRASPSTRRRPAWWPRCTTGRATRRRWWRCTCAARRQAGHAVGGPPMTANLEPVTVGALTPGDADRCAELETQLFDGDDPWPAVAFERELSRAAQPLRRRARQRCAGRLRRDLAAGPQPPFEYEVHTVGVDPAYQGQGSAAGCWRHC